MGIDGGNLFQLRRGGPGLFPKITPDGRDVVYQSWVEQGIYDGKLLAVAKVRHDPPANYLDILPSTGGPSIRQFDLPVLRLAGNPFSWVRDSKGLMFLDSRDGVGNLWLRPFSGGKPKQITNFSSDLIYSFDWSTDGKQLVVAGGRDGWPIRSR